MRKLTKISIGTGLILLVILGAFLLYVFFTSKDTGKTFTENIRDVFPQSGDVVVTTPDSDGSDLIDVITDNTGTPTEPAVIAEYKSRLTQITQTPVSGSHFTGTSSLRYIDKATGNVYEYDGNTSRKITNTTIPKLYDSYWVNADIFVGRYLSSDNQTIKSFVGTISNPGKEGSVAVEFLPNNIKSIAVSGSGKMIFYNTEDYAGSQGFIYNTLTKSSVPLFTKPVTELSSFYIGEDLYVFTNPSYDIQGSLFSVDTKSGEWTYEINNIDGLSVSSINTPNILVSSFGFDQSTFVHNTQTKGISPINYSLIPEKCVSVQTQIYCMLETNFSTSGLPDLWYRGEISFNDTFYAIDLNNPYSKIVDFDFTIPNVQIDAINLKASPDGKYIIFTNKKDGSLWRLEL